MDFHVRPLRGRWEPNADVIWDEARGLLVVTVEAAGADPESLRISVDGRRLFIFGRRCGISHAPHATFLQKEIASGEFIKQFQLPVAVREEEASATYADGLLEIALPVAQTEYVPDSPSEVRLIVKRILV